MAAQRRRSSLRSRRSDVPVLSDSEDDGGNASRASATTVSRPPAPAEGAIPISASIYLRLGRPKFLYYSLLCHGVGLLLARRQGRTIDWVTAFLAQATVWCCHLMTHYINEYGDVNADRLNTNAGSWTGGSKVLASGAIPATAALHLGMACLAATVACGAVTAARIAARIGGVALVWPASPSAAVGLLSELVYALPLEYVLLGLTVIAVALTYSLPPLRLSANALGEVCVAYVLTFAAPLTGLYAQGGHLDFEVACILLPACIINLNRMIIMNIPDRKGDALDSKDTSVVLLGEARAVVLTNVITLATFLMVIPQLGLPRAVTLSYFAPLPLRWWQTLRINIPLWWENRRLVDSIPFVESMYVLATVAALLGGLGCDLSSQCRAGIA